MARLTLYYIAIGDDGRSGPRIGCGDSVVATTTAPLRFTDQFGATMRALLSNRSRTIGQSGLHNSLSTAALVYLGHTVRTGTVSVYLSGTFSMGGVCDIPRVKAQLEYTAATAAGVKRAAIYIDDRPIDEVLSLK